MNFFCFNEEFHLPGNLGHMWVICEHTEMKGLVQPKRISFTIRLLWFRLASDSLWCGVSRGHAFLLFLSAEFVQYFLVVINESGQDNSCQVYVAWQSPFLTSLTYWFSCSDNHIFIFSIKRFYIWVVSIKIKTPQYLTNLFEISSSLVFTQNVNQSGFVFKSIWGFKLVLFFYSNFSSFR